MEEYANLVYITGFCMIASIASDGKLALLPVLMAILFPLQPFPAAFVAMFAAVLMSGFHHFIGRGMQ